MDPDALAAGVRRGERRALARAITLVESTRPEHRGRANRLLENLMPVTGKSMRIGISGVPGVGKSTFIEALGNHVVAEGHRVAVLAVDPSSALSGGSILGDKTRMERLARQARAFIRPSPTGATLGGVARRTREAILLCEAAGFDVVVVETVGVGQSEVAVAGMTDMFVLMLLPGGGDELQGIKRGIVELADLVVVNKADGELASAAVRAASDYQNALQFLKPRSAQWQVPVQTCSALHGERVAEVWQTVIDYFAVLSKNGRLASRRGQQGLEWMWRETADSLIEALKQAPEVRVRVAELETAVVIGRLPATVAAQQLINVFMERKQAKVADR
jgi:LAO/AO transport system kinase